MHIRLVPDTNVLIEDHLKLHTLLNENPPFYLSLFIPRIVLDELDRLKSKLKGARDAINFIKTLYKTPKLYVEGQQNHARMEIEIELRLDPKELEKLNKGTNDDKIIKFIIENDDCVFITRDGILALRVESFGIACVLIDNLVVDDVLKEIYRVFNRNLGCEENIVEQHLVATNEIYLHGGNKDDSSYSTITNEICNQVPIENNIGFLRNNTFLDYNNMMQNRNLQNFKGEGLYYKNNMNDGDSYSNTDYLNSFQRGHIEYAPDASHYDCNSSQNYNSNAVSDNNNMFFAEPNFRMQDNKKSSEDIKAKIAQKSKKKKSVKTTELTKDNYKTGDKSNKKKGAEQKNIQKNLKNINYTDNTHYVKENKKLTVAASTKKITVPLQNTNKGKKKKKTNSNSPNNAAGPDTALSRANLQKVKDIIFTFIQEITKEKEIPNLSSLLSNKNVKLEVIVDFVITNFKHFAGFIAKESKKDLIEINKKIKGDYGDKEKIAKRLLIIFQQADIEL